MMTEVPTYILLTNNAKSSWELKQGSICEHEIKLMTCHQKQAAREEISWI